MNRRPEFGKFFDLNLSPFPRWEERLHTPQLK
jgi:hypothetical protein